MLFRQVCHHAGSLDFGVITAAAGYLRKELDFYIFGFDVIIEKGTGMFCILVMLVLRTHRTASTPRPNVSLPFIHITLTMVLLDRPTLHCGP